MTTITIERELLEQALAALSAPNYRVFSESSVASKLRAALSAPATEPECKTSGGDARAVALARLLDQAYERGVAVGLSQSAPATAPDDLIGDCVASICATPATASVQPSWHDVPVKEICEILDDVIGIAVENGANSISMPDEYVKVAAWIASIPEDKK